MGAVVEGKRETGFIGPSADTPDTAAEAKFVQPSKVDAPLAQQQALAARIGVPDTLLVEAARRGLRTENGETRVGLR
jgi:hypothetical protein